MAPVSQAIVNPVTETAEQKLARVMAENETLRAQVASAPTGKLSFKVSLPRKPGTNGEADKGSEGGAVSVYGLGRFPVTLYGEQWGRLFEAIPALQAFIKANEKSLHTKADRVIAKAAA